MCATQLWSSTWSPLATILMVTLVGALALMLAGLVGIMRTKPGTSLRRVTVVVSIAGAIGVVLWFGVPFLAGSLVGLIVGE